MNLKRFSTKISRKTKTIAPTESVDSFSPTMSNDAEKGREPEQGYISPFIVLPHTLTREESKNLRETVYKYFEGQQRDTEWRRKRFKTEFVDEELDSMVFDEEEE